MSETASYKTVVKNTAIIGGSQAVQMLASLLRNKVAAIFLGATGIGINTLLINAIVVVQQFSAMGIFQSGVRELAVTREDPAKLSAKVKVFRYLAILCGITGVIACIILSPLLSKISFGGWDYTWHFIVLSVTLLFMALQSRSATIMQATGNLKLLAKGSIAGVIINLIISVILFYFFGINGIVPAIILGYAGFYAANRYFERRIPFPPTSKLSRTEMVAQSKPMLRQGSALMVSQLLMTLFTMLLGGFISNYGSVSDVGLFQPTVNICIQGMIVINATLASDYFPRLSAVCHDRIMSNKTINQQADIMLFIAVPISLLIIVAAPWIIRALMAPEFMVMVPILRIMGLSLVFRALWNILGFIALAKGDNKTYLIFDAILGNGSVFLLNIAAFYFMGLHGLGISYVVGAIFMVVVLGVMTYVKYDTRFELRSLINIALMIGLLLAVYFSIEFMQGIYGYVATAVLSATILIFSYRELNSRLDIWNIVKRKLMKK